MHRAKYVIPVLFALAAILGITGWWLYRAAQPIELALYFHPFVGPEPLVLNESRHPNPGGEGRFKVRDFQFFLSNIRLAGGTGVYTEPDSYHLVRFDGAEPAFGIVLHDVPRRDYQRIEFGIGVDAAANKSLAQRGDLNPNGRMAWNWEVGYKFVLFEGTLVRGNASLPLVYHVGFEENYRLIATELRREALDSRPARLENPDDRLFFRGAGDCGYLGFEMSSFEQRRSPRPHHFTLSDNPNRLCNTTHPSALRLSRGTFYLAQLGTSHLAATGMNQTLATEVPAGILDARQDAKTEILVNRSICKMEIL